MAGCPVDIPRHWEWGDFWSQIQDHLRRSGYRKGSRRLYRNVLRGFRNFCGCRPSEVTRSHIRDYLRHLGARRLSASWIGMNLAVLRLVFDRIYEQSLTGNLPGPRRPKRLPEILSPATIAIMLNRAESPRDRLLVGLIYGCGLRVGEACRLRWEDVDLEQSSIHVRNPTTDIIRTLRLPRQLIPALRDATAHYPSAEYVFRGQKPGSHLSIRMAEYLVSSLARRTVPGVRVTSFLLRHTYAVHSLEAGMNIRELQQALGHLHIDTTVRYLRLLLPDDAVSPLDRIDFAPPAPAAPASDQSADVAGDRDRAPSLTGDPIPGLQYAPGPPTSQARRLGWISPWITRLRPR